MHLRLAREQDLIPLKNVYQEIIEEMNRTGIAIWDDFYPCGLFPGDIARGQLYILEEEDRILAAFALCPSDPGEPHVQWKSREKRALFIDRFGVSVHCRNRGIGSRALELAGQMADRLGAEVLRLFVVDINGPAVALYEKNGFTRAEGIYTLKISPEFQLQEYGYEKPVQPCADGQMLI